MVNFKKILLLFLLFFFLFQASSVFALEIKWPSLPGAETPNQIQEKVEKGLISKENTLPSFINYFLRLFYLIAILVAIGVIIFGGVLWLLSPAKPVVLVSARQWISRGLMGLLILFCSYLVLATINPQLLVFRVKYPSPGLTIPAEEIPPSNQITFLGVPFGSLIDQTLEDLDETVKVANLDEKVKGTFQALLKPGEDPNNVRKIEVPLLEILTTLNEVIDLSKALKANLEKCKCGTSKSRVEWEGAKGKCVGGKEKEDSKFLEWVKTQIFGGQAICQNRCDNCGTINCDLREVQRKPDDPTIIEIEQTFGKGDWKDITKAPNATKTSIKYQRMRLQELLAELETQKLKLTTDQIGLIEKTLGINAGSYLLSQSESLNFQEDFSSQEKTLKDQGWEVLLEKPPQFAGLKPEKIAADPFSFYAPLEGRMVLQPIKEKNQEAYRMSQRASLFAVLTQLTLEDIENMIQECLNSAFGEGQFVLDPDDLSEIVGKALQEGIANYLDQALEGEESNLAQAFLNKLREGIEEESEKKAQSRISRCKEKCPPPPGDQKCQAKCQEEADCLAKCAGDKKCQAKCTLPPYFLSNVLADFLTKDIKDQLPAEIKKVLNEKLREFIFDQGLNQILSEDMVKLLDGIFQGALSKSLEEQIPFLRENLPKKVAEVLPDLISDPLQQIDAFLAKHLKDLKKKIDAEIADLVMKLGEELSKPALALIDNYKEKNPYEFKENLTPVQCRNLYQNNGYFYDYAGGGKCRKATLDEINTGTYHIDYFHVSKEQLCRMAKYCWNKVDQKCEECQWIDLKGLAPTAENFRRWAEAFLVGLVNFAEQFLVALTQTAIYTLTRYSQVWVEDEIITPLQPYLLQLSNFQKNLHNFLLSTIRELLPQQIIRYLESNVEQIVKTICAGQPINLYRGTEPITISEDLKNKACALDRELHQSLLDNLAETGPLGQEIVTALNNTFYDNICKAQAALEGKENCQDQTCRDNCILSFLQKSLAEILWPDARCVKDVIKGTPKQILCGEIVPVKNGDVDCSSSITLKSQCDLMRTPYAGLIFPVINESNTEFKKNPDFYVNLCPAIWLLCDSPKELLSFNLGSFIKTAAEQECQEVYGLTNTKCTKARDCETCPAGEEALKTKCQSCDVVVTNSLAFTFFRYQIEENYGKDIAARTTQTKEKERAAFQYLYVAFPEPKIRADLQKLATQKRGFTSQEWSNLVSEVQHITNPTELPASVKELAISLINWFSQDSTYRNILTSIPFGVMSYFHPKEKEGADYVYGPNRNFLARTPYQLLSQDACGKIKWQFQKDFPNSTIERIMAGEYTKTRGALPYSMEGLERPTYGEAVQILLQSTLVPEEEKAPYLFCWSLDHTPAQILGLDQPLARYIRPKEYQILFALIKDKLKPDERPDALNDLLDYLYTYTPTKLMRKIGDDLIKKGLAAEPDDINLIADGQRMKELADFLEKRIGQQLREKWSPEADTQIIDLILCQLPNPPLDCTKRLGWEDWRKIQEFLAKTPLEHIVSQLNKIFFDLLPPELRDALSKSIMERIAQNSILGEPYIDTLGRTLHLTGTIYEFYLDNQELHQKINEGVKEVRARTQDAFNKILIEYPKAGINWLLKTLAKVIGLELGGKTADRMAGVCRKASNLELIQGCPESEVYNQKTKECCGLDQGLVCQLRCRTKSTDEECKVKEGEIESPDKTQCCFDEKCRRCRQATMREEKEKKCFRDEKKEIFDETRGDFKLCCQERIKKEENCCTNIMQCVVDKFTFHLELLGDVLVEGPALENLVPSERRLPYQVERPAEETCPTDLKTLCPLPKKLARCSGVSYPAQRAPELQALLDCIERETGKPLPQENQSNTFYGSFSTYDNTYPLCNYTHGQPICGKCSHTVFSCHYGGKTGTSGALAVDFGNEGNFETIKNATIKCGVPVERILYESNKDRPGYHIHISHPLCQQK